MNAPAVASVKVRVRNNSAASWCTCGWRGIWYIGDEDGERQATEDATSHAEKSGHALEPQP